jgi:trk system potassium uptake protein TrkH
LPASNTSSRPTDSSHHHRLPRWFSRLLALAVLVVVVWEVGFEGTVSTSHQWTTALLVALFCLEHLINWRRSERRKEYLRRWGFHISIGVLAAGLMIALLSSPWLESHGGKLTILLYGLVQGAMLLSLGLRALRHQAQITGLNIRPGWLFMGSFILIIGIGTVLLKLPRAIQTNETFSWLDALFTSTSAVCVTGLAVENTAHFFTPTGQVILLGLIQIGGLGIMTLTFYIGTVLFSGMSLHDRQVLGEMISEKHLARVSDSLRFIVVFTFVTEALGAVLLFQCLPADRGLAERIFQSVFHSVSAFCNAGFSTLPDGLADGWIRDNGSLQLVICALIILGGVGAAVLRDGLAYVRQSLHRLRDPAHQRPRLRVHTRLVLTTTLILLFGGAAAIWVSEFWFHSGESNDGQMLTAFFHSVTTRTAGFNTVDMGGIGPVTVHLMVMLMLIGGSPGGTAGGVRTTVFAIATAHLWNLLRSTPDLVLFRRKLPADVGPRALSILVLTMGWLFVNFAILRQIQPDVPDTKLVFELVSAFATVGLSLNLTGDLTEAAKWLILINMFVGRIGLFTVLSTLTPLNRKRPAQRPTEDIILA